MAQVLPTLQPVRRFGETSRTDLWWLKPLAILMGLAGFVAYSTWAAFQGEYYTFGPYLSPFYSPELFGDSHHAIFGPRPGMWPVWLPFSPAFLILWAPVGFRLTCYYYRGTYYKSFWADPPACAVGEPRKSYLGERSLPLVLQNVHRYFLYLALGFLLFLTYDAWKGFWFEDGLNGESVFGIGLGSIILCVNVLLLGSYTLGCHSLRHVIGGKFSQLSKRPLRSVAYGGVSCLNRWHMVWAWSSLVWVAFTDIYIRLCSMGVWTDPRLF
jgi:hypothetical protein